MSDPSTAKTADVRLLIDLLTQDRRWVTAKQITVRARARRSIGRPWHRRYIAELAQETDGRIISTTHGYKLQDFATLAEILGSYNELRKKAENTGKTASAIWKYYHHHNDESKTEQPNQTDLFDKKPVPTT